MKLTQPTLWWGPPKKFAERVATRKVSWLELFYDLAYAAAVSQLSHQLVVSAHWETLGRVALLFALLFWSWVNGTQYYDLHGSDGIRTRMFTFLQMLAVVAACSAIPDVFAGKPQAFAIAFLAVQGIITYLWWSVGRYDPSHRILNKPYGRQYNLAFLPLTAVLFLPESWAVPMLCIAMVLDITPGWVGSRFLVRVLKERGETFTASETLVERFGLFTIIILAESVLGTVSGIAAVHSGKTMTWLAALFAILIAFCLWSLYFDQTSEQKPRKGYGNMLVLIYLHYPLLLALSVVGATVKIMLEHAGEMGPMESPQLLGASLALYLGMVAGILHCMQWREADRKHYVRTARGLYAVALICLAMTVLANRLNGLSWLIAASAILLVPVLAGMRHWARRQWNPAHPGVEELPMDASRALNSTR